MTNKLDRQAALAAPERGVLAQVLATKPLAPAGVSRAPAAEPPRESVARTLGLHPLVAFGMFACDWMLFGGEAGSAGVGLALTIPIALALMVPCILIQRYTYRDGWGAAIGKGLMVGLLTAIPMPIGSPVTLAGGVLGLLGRRKKPLLPAPAST